VNKSLAGTDIYGYGYYDTRTRPVNMRVSKIPIPAGSGYPFLIFISYPLRVLSASTDFFDIPIHDAPILQLESCIRVWHVSVSNTLKYLIDTYQ